LSPTGEALHPGQRLAVLLVEDSAADRRLIAEMLRDEGDEIELATTPSAVEALDHLERETADAVLLDLSLPDATGLQSYLLLSWAAPDVPVVVVTGSDDRELAREAVRRGAQDYLVKGAFDGASLLRAVHYAVDRHHLVRQLRESSRQLEVAHLDTIRRLVVASEHKDRDTAFHIERIGEYVALIAEALGAPRGQVELLRHASPMHDVGKIGVPDSILLKPGPLTEEERRTMERHTTIGGRILHGSPSPLLQAGEVIALSHHERWDGTGYPGRLAGEDIPLAGRICAVADVFDALTSDRPYRRALPVERALEMMRAERGRHFDPRVLEAFESRLARVIELHESWRPGGFLPASRLSARRPMPDLL
jgi:putative two-component system response regulator